MYVYHLLMLSRHDVRCDMGTQAMHWILVYAKIIYSFKPIEFDWFRFISTATLIKTPYAQCTLTVRTHSATLGHTHNRWTDNQRYANCQEMILFGAEIHRNQVWCVAGRSCRNQKEPARELNKLPQFIRIQKHVINHFERIEIKVKKNICNWHKSSVMEWLSDSQPRFVCSRRYHGNLLFISNIARNKWHILAWQS